MEGCIATRLVLLAHAAELAKPIYTCSISSRSSGASCCPQAACSFSYSCFCRYQILSCVLRRCGGPSLLSRSCSCCCLVRRLTLRRMWCPAFVTWTMLVMS